MLSTKNLPDTNVPKTFGPGNITASITRIELAPGPAYKPGSYQVNIHLEGPDMGNSFEGFYKDAVNKTGERYKGQVGKVRMSEYPFADGITKKGTPVNRDESIMRGLQNLARVVGKEKELNDIEVPTIEELVAFASELLSGSKPVNWCIGGKEYTNKDGYLNYDLFLPATKGLGYAYEAVGATPSKLLTFDPATHIVKKKDPEAVIEFEPEVKLDTSFNL